MENSKSDSSKTANTTMAAPESWYGARHTQVILMVLLIAIIYGMRVNLSVGIVAMTNPNASSNPDVPTYKWDDQSIMLSSFFWGYVLPQVGAGLLSQKYGPKWILAGTTLIGSIFTLLIPVVAPLGSWAIMLCRIVQGFTQGFSFPCCHSLLAKWVPPAERARLGSFVYSSVSFGTVISMPFTGWLSGTSVGWPYAFYTYGAAGLLWSIMWVFLGKNSPAEHERIDPYEKKYIETSLGQVEMKITPPTPWRAVFTSLPVWAIIIVQSANNWGFATLLTNIPTYMANILNFDIKNNGLLSAGPYLANWAFSFVFSIVTDYIIVHKYVTTGCARKIANSVAVFAPAAALLALAVISNSFSDIANVTLVLLFIGLGCNGSCVSGYFVNHMDLSPVHSATLMGITNGIANIFGIIAPLIVQFIVTDQHNPLQWATVFYISSAIYFFGIGFYLIFGSGEIQPWNHVKSPGKVETVEGVECTKF